MDKKPIEEEKGVEETKEIIKETRSVAQSPENVMNMIDKAVSNGVAVETIERLFELHQKVQQEYARSVFVDAMARFQEECPPIERGRTVKNKHGKELYKFAPLDQIIDQIAEPLKKAKLSFSWDTSTEGDMVRATAKVTHVLGHSESSSFEVPVDKGSKLMSRPQSYAAALTFAKRYALINVLGITTADEDIDAIGDGEAETHSKKSNIILRLRRLGYNTKTRENVEEAIKKTCGSKMKLTEENYDEIIEMLNVIINEKNMSNESN